MKKKNNQIKRSKGGRVKATRVLVLLLAVLPAAVCSRAYAEDTDITVKTAKGKVEVRETGGKTWKPTAAGNTVAAGMEIRTGPGAEALLLWPQGHAVKVFPLSMMTISEAASEEDAENTKLEMNKGKMFSKVSKLASKESTFQVKTPTAIAGVRGTEFMMEMQEDNTCKISLLEGQLDVIGEQVEQVLEQNSAIEIGANMAAPPQPVEISPEVKTEMESISKSIDAEIGASTGEQGNKQTGAQGQKPSSGPEQKAAPEQAQTQPVTHDAEIIQQVIETKMDDIKAEVIETQRINLPPLPPPAP